MDPFFASATSADYWVSATAILLPATLLMGICPSRRPLAAQQPLLRNQAAQSARAVRNWHRGFKRIRRLLRLCILWSELGRHLQTPQLLGLTQGLERRQGKLVRVVATDVAIQNRIQRAIAKAAARARLPTQR